MIDRASIARTLRRFWWRPACAKEIRKRFGLTVADVRAIGVDSVSSVRSAITRWQSGAEEVDKTSCPAVARRTLIVTEAAAAVLGR
jgi:hypothetical protein